MSALPKGNFSPALTLCGNNTMNAAALKTTTLIFWAAALMWSVDGIASVLGGESFFDISIEDSILGAIIVVAGCAFFGLLSILHLKKS